MLSMGEEMMFKGTMIATFASVGAVKIMNKNKRVRIEKEIVIKKGKKKRSLKGLCGIKQLDDTAK